jgi:hypothetical protein
MPGWRIALAAFASLMNRVTSSGFDISSLRTSLTATVRPSVS